jgi:hypothetical protein
MYFDMEFHLSCSQFVFAISSQMKEINTKNSKKN